MNPTEELREHIREQLLKLWKERYLIDENTMALREYVLVSKLVDCTKPLFDVYTRHQTPSIVLQKGEIVGHE